MARADATSLHSRWLLAAVLVGSLATVSAAARAVDGPKSDRRASTAGPQSSYPVDRGFVDQELSRRLEALTDQELTVLETAMPQPPATNGQPPDDGEDMMMADMPPSTDDAQVTVQPDDQAVIRESNKKQRLRNIKLQILNYLNRAPSPSPIIKPNPNASSSSSLSSNQNVFQNFYQKLGVVSDSYPFDTFTEKTQSFYPGCSLPKHTNEEAWYSTESMNIMFNITIARPSNENFTVNVTTATLRLFKQFLNCTSLSSNETADGCPEASLEDTTSKRPNINTQSASAEAPATMMEDRQIRVSVYMYTRTLKKRKMRRRLLDSRMVPYYSEKWTEWNIRSAVKIWRQDPSRNFGLSIEIEDEDGNVLPIERFFKSMNCSPGMAQMSTPKPIPGFLVEYGFRIMGGANGTANVSALSPTDALYSNAYRYPMLDLSTIEVPNSEQLKVPNSDAARKSLLQAISGHAMERYSDVPKSMQQKPNGSAHRIRHNSTAAAAANNNNNNNRHKTDGRPTLQLSDVERELQGKIIVVQRNVPMPTSDTEDGDSE
ncbi:Hypothetical protein CINCED_3A017224 [Cinara cedri]|uniref:TGF-beta propeptide domain-containing protein n=1 Tax=Cinara cedri TaxID=506608 RepID=A0A5E4MZ00_9HEMI|nr:Hypothetical protein CINCED_3A017224 [Cinara cedri]